MIKAIQQLSLVASVGTLVAALFLAGCTKKSGDGAGAGASAGKKKFVSIGTGGVTGVYYPVGQALASMLNKKEDELNLKASAQSTAGSVYNLNAVSTGSLEFGLVQSDRQYQAVNGLAEWKGKPQTNVRAMFSMHTEMVAIMVADDTGAQSLADLKGRRINIGQHGSGIRGNALDVFSALGIDYKKDYTYEELGSSEAPRMLQDNRIDAFFWTSGQPSGVLTEATAGKRKVRFLPIPEADAQKVLAKFPYYATDKIDLKLYPQALKGGLTHVSTVGVKATMVTSSQVPEDVVYNVTREVFENFQAFRKLHPAMASLEKPQLLQGLSMTVHKGSMKYFKEAGLVQHLPKNLQ